MKNNRLFYLLSIIIPGMDHPDSLLSARIAWERANDDYKADSPFQLKQSPDLYTFKCFVVKILPHFSEWNNRGNTYRPIRRKKESVLPFAKVLGLILKFSFLKLYKDTTSERRSQVFGLVFPTFIFSFFILLIFLR